MPVIKAWNRRAIKKGQSMKFGESVRNLVVAAIDLANPIALSGAGFLTSRVVHFAIMSLIPSHTVPPCRLHLLRPGSDRGSAP